MRLNPYQVAEYAYRGGFRGADLVRAVAVALAESSGNTDARNTHGGNDARGLWQINVKPGAHPQWASRNLYDPLVNAQTAHELQARDGWRPWNSSLAGQAATTPIAAPAVAMFMARHPGDTASDAASGAVGAVVENVPGAGAAKAGLDVANRVGTWTANPRNWLRVALVLVGGALLVAAAVVAARPVVEPAVRAGVKVAKVAAA